ncbi:MAG: sigma-70 family RNA polymerase sigma factor [Candidatus Eremiobacteraeota bacterium]|nr:sigma-70 family RNA polymerase sigma factor [Candidatus Eremiobacteraeota bacterium]
MTTHEREATILQLQPIVQAIAHVTWRRLRGTELDDLIGDGYLGLIAAVDTFDAARGMSLERYARRKVLYAMVDGARRTAHLSQLSRRVLQNAERDRYSFAMSVGRMPSPRELEQRNPKLRSAQCSAQLRRPVSIDAAQPIDALVPLDWRTDPASLLCAHETEVSVRRALDRLPERHRELLGLYYGAGFRLEALANRLSLTKQRVAQLRDHALAKLRREVVAS